MKKFRQILALMLMLYVVSFGSCSGTKGLNDGGSTVGPGFYPAGNTYVTNSEQGIAIVCRSDTQITSLASLVTKELSKQKLTISEPTGNLSEASLSVLNRLSRLDSGRATTLNTAMTARLDDINFATSPLSAVSPVAGAVIPSGCKLERVYEEVGGNIMFTQELWDAASTSEKSALLTELTIKQNWTPAITAEKSRSLAGLLMSQEISKMKSADYQKYLNDLNSN